MRMASEEEEEEEDPNNGADFISMDADGGRGRRTRRKKRDALHSAQFGPLLCSREKRFSREINTTPLCRKVPAKLIVFPPIFPKMADLAGCG